jgi:cold shock CspA family protein/ribosome-associated translation inhibitor RaiA
MEIPLELSFQSIEPSDAVKAAIRERVDKLGVLYDRMVIVRVHVLAEMKRHRTGNIYTVNIELGVPGNDLIVSKAPHKAKRKYADPDLYTVIREAFDAAERQLKDFKAQLGGDVKTHDSDLQLQGQVTKLKPEEDYGFLLTTEGGQLYFHRNSVLNHHFDKLKEGDMVPYIETRGATGPIASKVRLGSDRTEALGEAE